MKSDSNSGVKKYNYLFEKGFFNIPEIENISENPETIYKYEGCSSRGQLHAKKIKNIYDSIIQDHGEGNGKPNLYEVQSILEDHQLAKDLTEMTQTQVADFLRHVFYINRDQIGWDNSEALVSQLNEKYLPTWKLPDYAIDNNFRYVLRLMIADWSLPSDIQELITMAQKKVIEYYGDGFQPTKLWTKPIESFSYWNVMMLSDLYETINSMVYVFKILDADQYLPIIELIEAKFEEMINHSLLNVDQKIILELIYSHGLMIKSIEDIIKVKSRISTLWLRMKRNPTVEEEDYHWIFGSFYCQIYANLMDFEIDIVTRKMIISDVINNYLKPNEVDFEKWKEHIVSANMHPWTFAYKIQGYAEILYALLDHSQDLVIEVNRDQIIDYHKQLTIFLYDVIKDFARKHANISIDDISAKELVLKLSNLSLPIAQIDIIQSTLFHVVKNYLLYHSELDQVQRKLLVDLNTSIINSMYHQEYTDIFELDMKLHYRNDELMEIFELIKKDLKQDISLINSETFEKEIIRKFANLYHLVVNKTDQKFSRFHKYALEVILWYLSYWYWKFQEHEVNTIESQMILAPFIGLIMKNLAIYYYQYHQNTKAHLMLINTYFFQTIAGLIDNRQKSLKDQVNEVMEKFGQYFFDIVYKLDSADTKLKQFISYSFEKNNKKININDLSHHGYDIEDDAVMNYMDLRDEYHDFINQSKKLGPKDLVDLILQSNLYTLPNENSPLLIRKMGKNIPEKVLRQHPFPLIRNLHKYGIAIKLFPVTIQLPNFMIDMEL